MKNETKKLNNIDNQKITQKIREFLSIISSKKDVIKIFKKRYINHINKNNENNESFEKKEITTTIKIRSLNNLLNEFEKLIQLSLELIWFFQDVLKKNSNTKIKNDESYDKKELFNVKNFYDSKNYISNLNITDKLKYKKYSKKYNNNTFNNFDTDIIDNYKPKNADLFSNYRNYNSVNSLVRNNHINSNEHISYNFDNIVPSLKEKTLRTLYKDNYSQNENNIFLNIKSSFRSKQESKIRIPIRNVLRALIKENKVYINKIWMIKINMSFFLNNIIANTFNIF